MLVFSQQPAVQNAVIYFLTSATKHLTTSKHQNDVKLF